MGRSIVLSGFMATGKSTVGKLLAARLGLPFVDTDAALEELTGKTTAELFAGEGEGRFREREAELVLRLLGDGVQRVLGFGGGTVTIPRVRHAALESSLVVTLTASAEKIVGRVESVAARPNLRALSTIDRIRDMLDLRRRAYAECHLSLATDTMTPAALAGQIATFAAHDTLAMPLGERSYVVEMTDGKPTSLADALAELAPSSVLVVTDENVHAARSSWLGEGLARVPSAELVVLPPGEENKTITTVQRIWDHALTSGVDRRAVVVAFGGGVVGDLAGFAASTLLRGVRCVQIPTTLLSMVDSSVGGKTGFDHVTGKNLLGSFFQPSRVIVDLEHLTTLDPRQVRAGIAEVAKIAYACDATLLASLERSATSFAFTRGALSTADRMGLRALVRDAVAAKIRVVRDDETEAGARALLNLGHTVGHALEAQAGFRDLLHGEAVAIGTVLEMEATTRMGFTPVGLTDEARALFAALGLPTTTDRASVEASLSFLKADKKRSAASIRLPVVRGRGSATVEKVAIDAFSRALLA